MPLAARRSWPPAPPSPLLPTEPAGGDSADLRQYPLYPYLVAARLSRQLALALPAADATVSAAAAGRRDRRVPCAGERAAGEPSAATRVAVEPRRSGGSGRASSQTYDASTGYVRRATLSQIFAARIALGQTDNLASLDRRDVAGAEISARRMRRGARLVVGARWPGATTDRAARATRPVPRRDGPCATPGEVPTACGSGAPPAMGGPDRASRHRKSTR